MMALGLVALLALVLGGLFGLGLIGYPGYLLLVWEGLRLETSIWVALAVLLLAIVLLFALYFTLAGLISVPSDGLRVWRSWRERRALQRSNDSIIDWLNGNWQRSYKVARRSINSSPAPVLHCLIAADAALHNQEITTAEQALADARKYLAGSKSGNQKEVNFALTVFDARLAFLRADYAQCLQLLQPLLTSKRAQVLKLYQQACLQSHNFVELERLLPKLKSQLNLEDWQALRKQTYAELFAAVDPELEPDKKLAEFSQIWRRLPKDLHQGFVLTYAQGLLSSGAYGAAEQILGKELEARFDQQALQSYLGIEQVDDKRKLKLLEKLKDASPEQLDLVRACAQLCLQLKLWGQAESYLQQLASADAWSAYALAKLLAAQGDSAAASEREHAALELSARAWQALPTIPDLRPASEAQ